MFRAFASLIWKSLYKVLPPKGTLLQNMAAVIRQTAFPFIMNRSWLGRGRLCLEQTLSTHLVTSALDQVRGSQGRSTSSGLLELVRLDWANQGMLMAGPG